MNRLLPAAVVAFTFFSVGCAGLPEAVSVEPTDVPFVEQEGFKNGLVVDKVTVSRARNRVEFAIEVTSDQERGLTLFNPSRGDVISLQRMIPEGDSIVRVYTSAGALRRVDAVTVNFSIPGTELTGRIFLDYSVIAGVLADQ